MNEESSVEWEETSEADEDSESSGVLHQYEDIYKLRFQLAVSFTQKISSESCLQRDCGGAKAAGGRCQKLLFSPDIPQCGGSFARYCSHDRTFVLEFLSKGTREVYFPTIRKCKTSNLSNIQMKFTRSEPPFWITGAKNKTDDPKMLSVI